MKSRLLAAVLIAALTGCAGHIDYTRPTAAVRLGSNTTVVAKPLDEVWKAAVPKLAKHFFVINNLDRSSGLINISYTGNPETYVDCGVISSYVQNARGKRTYTFSAASAHRQYQIMDLKHGAGLLTLDRRMKLEGRMNLIFEAVSSTQTRVSANTKYILTRDIVATKPNGATSTFSDDIGFNSESMGSFPPNSDGETLDCVPTGQFEREILALIK